MDYKSGCCELEEEKGTQRICMVNEIRRLEHTNIKSDSFFVDMDSFSHTINKDVSSPNSRFTRSLTRKGSQREENTTVPTSPPTGASTPQKSIMPGPTDYASNPQIHHQITIAAGNNNTAVAATTTESKLAARRLSFKRSSLSRTVDPRRILFFFATLSSMGSILLIYFTLSMGKFNGHDNAVDW